MKQIDRPDFSYVVLDVVRVVAGVAVTLVEVSLAPARSHRRKGDAAILYLPA